MKGYEISKILLSNTYILCLILFFQNSELAIASSDENTEKAPTIYAVEITGNHITSSELILQEMELKPGSLATSEALAFDQNNIESLGLFNRVKLIIASDADRAVLLVEVSEPFYIYPFVSGDYNPNDPDLNFWGGGIYHINIMGKGIRLSGFLWDGYRRGVSVNYDDLWYSFAGKYGLKGSVYLANNEVTDQINDKYRADSQRYMLGLRRRLGHARQCLHLEILWEITECESDSYTLTTSSTDRIASAKLILENDLRNYQYYPSSGIYTLFEVSGNRVVDISHNFLFERIDMRGYKQLKTVIFAGRIWGHAAHYTLPYHKRIISLIRAGEVNEYPKGTVLGMNIEMRFNLIKKRYYSLAKLPLIGSYLHNLGFSLEGVIFGDAGFHATAESGFDENLAAWGGGLQMQVPFINTIHFLLGWTPTAKINQPSLTFKTGVTF